MRRATCVAIAGVCGAAAALTMVSAPSQAVAPGINGRLVTVANYDVTTRDIYLMNPADPSDRVNLTGENQAYIVYSPQASPDGTRIAYSRSGGSTDQIYVMNADGTDKHALTTEEQGGGSHPTWSPDGSHIAFTRGGDIYTMADDGTEQVALATQGSSLHSPEYSPDGNSIAYVLQHTAGGSQLVTEPAGGGTETFRTPFNTVAQRPSWSPDGSRLLFFHNIGGVQGLYTKSPTASADSAPTLVRQMTDLNLGSYAWSPEGDRIVFQSKENGDEDLYVMDADGTDVAQVTPTADGIGHEWASWSAEISTPTPLAQQTQGIAMTPIQLDFGGSGSTYALAAGVLPPGLSLSGAGVISGTPTEWGTRIFTVAATGGTSPGTEKFSIHVVDPEDPVVSVNSPAASTPTSHSTTISLNHPLSWGSSDGTSGSETYDVRTRRAPWSGGFGSYTYPAALQGLDVNQRNHPLSAGGTDCFEARATDASGRTGQWSPEKCTIAPLDQTSATKSSGWTTKTGSTYFGGSAWQTSTKGKTITRTGAQLQRLGVVATTCPTCGKVDLLVGTTVIGRINLGFGTKTLHRKPLMLPAFSQRSGTVKVKVATAGKMVRIDGLLIGAR